MASKLLFRKITILSLLNSPILNLMSKVYLGGDDINRVEDLISKAMSRNIVKRCNVVIAFHLKEARYSNVDRISSLQSKRSVKSRQFTTHIS